MIKSGTQSIAMRKEHLQYQAILMKRKVTALIAFATTIFLLCIENVKAFAAPFSSPDTLMMLATGAHSLVAKHWKTSRSVNARATSNLSPPTTGSPNTIHGPNTISSSYSHVNQCQGRSTTSLRMAFGFGVPTTAPSPSPNMLDMKTSINAFGSWYNQMDPVARPPVYDDDVMDYSFTTSSTENWPSSFDEDEVMMIPVGSSSSSSRKPRRPRPIRTIRKIAGWIFGSPAGKNARGFGAQSFL